MVSRVSPEEKYRQIEYVQEIVKKGLPQEVENSYLAALNLKNLNLTNTRYFTDATDEVFAQIHNTIESFEDMYYSDVSTIVDEINRIIATYPGSLENKNRESIMAAEALWDDNHHARLFFVTDGLNQPSVDA